MTNGKKVLIVSWSFYPDHAMGAHRAGKLCKYLPLYEWQPMVLTVKEKYYQVTDPSLLTQLPSDIRIKRTSCFSESGVRTGVKKILCLLSRLRGKEVANLSEITFKSKMARKLWLEIPEAGWWLFAAVRSGVKMARGCDVVWATSPVAGNLVVAAIIARLSGKPLVIDLRDPWRIEGGNLYPTPIHNFVDLLFEKRVFKSADAIIAVTPRIAEMYLSK